MKRFFLAFIAIFLIVLSALLYEVSSASAASPYDDLVQIAPNLVIEKAGPNTTYPDTIDVSVDWYSQAEQTLQKACQVYPSDCARHTEFTSWLSNDEARWIVLHHGSGYQILVSTDPNAKLTFVTIGNEHFLSLTGSNNAIRNFGVFNYYPGVFNYQSPDGIVNTSPFSSYTTYNFNASIFLSTFPVEYPDGYDGEIIPDTYVPPEKVELTPEYQYSVNSNGLLSVTYLKNITPFLSGTNYFVLNRTTENWETLGAQIFSESFTPAGWTDKTFEQLLDPGYYVLRISHSQTFDSNSPWSDKDVWVHDVYIQFFWDGETTFTGTTTGCEGQICNIFQTDESEKMWNMFEKLGLGHDEFGLGAAVTAPLTFIAALPSKAANCTPISLTLPYVNRQITLPCMTSVYQTHFGLIFSLFQTIMLGLFGYYAAVKVYGNIKQMKDPDDDSIEVVKL